LNPEDPFAWEKQDRQPNPADELSGGPPPPGLISGGAAPAGLLSAGAPPAELPPVNPPPPVPLTRWQKFWRWEYTGLLIILVVTLGFHFGAIMRPNSIIWDEKWYVGDARSIVTGGGDVRPEHPPLSKLFIVAGELIFNGFKVPQKETGETLTGRIGSEETTINVKDASVFTLGTTIRIDREQMYINGIDTGLNRLTVERDSGGTGRYDHTAGAPIWVFTDNAFGWRFFSIIFGTLGIVLFFFICRKLKLSLRTTLLATFLFAFEDMTFMHSSLALLDVYMVTFMLMAIYLYLNENYLLMGVFIALSAECKLVGVLIFIALALHFLIYRRQKWERFVGSFVVAAVAYVAFIVLFDFLLTGGWENPVTRINAMLTGTAANVFSDPKLSISSYPWTWLYPQFIQLYYNSPNVPFIVYGYDPQYISFISTTIQILIVPALGYMAAKAARGSQTAGLLLLWFLATYLVWIPLTIITNRVTFVFYFLSTIPAMCIGLGMAIGDLLEWLKRKREKAGRTTGGAWAWYSVIGFYLLLHLAIFVVLNPAIPTIIKTWLPPFTIGIDPTAANHTLNTLAGNIRALITGG
jgi:dolichyl-phosphate-mannose-protein mannosyltransferase